MSKPIVVLFNKEMGHRLEGGSKVDLPSLRERAAAQGLDVEVINEDEEKRGAGHARKSSSAKQKK